MDITLASLYAEIRRHGSIPNSGGTGSENTDLLAYINSNLTDIAAEVIKCREGFYRQYKDHTISSSTTRYRIPTRAIGNRLDCVLLLDSTGKIVRKLTEQSYGAASAVSALADTAGYFVEAGDVVLTPAAPTGVTTLRMVYYNRPPQVSSSLDAASGRCFTVTAVNTSTGVITLMASHGLTSSSSVDIMKGGSPFEYINGCVGISPSASASTTITVADASRVEVGDYVCQADYAPMPQVPDAFWSALVVAVARDFWLSLGDSKQAKGFDEQYVKAVKQAVAIVSPRIEEGGQKIKSPYGALGALYGPARRVY